MTAFDPQNWTQCVAPRLMGLTLTVMIHQYLRSLTLKVLGTIQTTCSQSVPGTTKGFLAVLRHLDEFSPDVHTSGVCPTSCEGSSYPLSVRLEIVAKARKLWPKRRKKRNPSGPPPFGAPTLLGPTTSGPLRGYFSGFGAPPFGAPPD